MDNKTNQSKIETIKSKISGENISNYWKQRYNFLYYKYINIFLRILAIEANSILDVGSNGTPILEYCTWIPNKISIDKREPYQSETVKGVKIDFFDYKVDEKFEFATCLQVLEHIKDQPENFCKKLFEVSKSVLISVPYKWGINEKINHYHNVDEEVLLSWTGRKPDSQIIVIEKTDRTKRMIAYYHDKTKTFEDFIDLFDASLLKY